MTPRRFRFSANLSMLFTELPALERFAAAAAAGFESVEWQAPFDMSVADMRSRLDDCGLPCNHINTPMGAPGDFGLAALTGREDEFARAIDLSLDYAVKLGARTIHCMSGCVAPTERIRATGAFLRNMDMAADKAKGTGVTFVIEPLNTRDRPGYFISRSDETVALLATLNRPEVKLLFDVYHIQAMEGDLLRRIERHWPFIGHVQIAGAPLRHEPDEGEVAYDAIYRALAQRGYEGFVGAEYKPRGATLDGLGWLGAAKTMLGPPTSA